MNVKKLEMLNVTTLLILNFVEQQRISSTSVVKDAQKLNAAAKILYIPIVVKKERAASGTKK